MSQALAGIRVLEIADRSAVLAGRILADLGAEVVLVEPPGGSPLRSEAPFLGNMAGSDRGFGHLYMNTNKRSVVLDIESVTDRDEFLKLVAASDVIVETLPPGWLEENGIGHEQLVQVRGGLIHCSVTPFGLATPWCARRANDLVAGAAGGLLQVSGEPKGVPVQGGSNPSFTMAGLAAASAITMALHQRDFGREADRGKPVHIDLSLQEATALAVMQTATPGQWQWHGRIPRRPGLSAAMVCRDGKYVSLLVRPDRFKQFLSWAGEVGVDHGMTPDDWEWARLDSPREGNPVSATLLGLAAVLTRDEFVEGALHADIICLPVLDFPDLEKAEQYGVNDQFLSLNHEIFGEELGYVRSPVDAMADGVQFHRAPALGEHQDLLEDLPEPLVNPVSYERVLAGNALEGIRVVDFGWVLAAPIGTRLLASFGAEVIRIESSTKPDSMRSQLGPEGKPDPDLGGLFNAVNAGKKSLAVDLTTERGLDLVKELIATSDVVVNNFRPGALDRMGLGYDVLKSVRENIILLNLPGAHRNGPWAQRPSMGNILMAASGFNMLTGFPNERPRGIGVAYPDFTSPHLLVTCVLAALRHRHATGNGQELHLTQLSAVLSLLGAEWMQFKATGVQPPRNANRNPNFCPHGVYPTLPEDDPVTDTWVAIAVRGDDEWRRFCVVTGMNELADDSRFHDHGQRRQHEDELDHLIRDWTAGQDKWQLADRLQAAGIAAAPVEHLKDMMEVDPQLPHHYQQLNQPVAPETDIPIDREAARWYGLAHDLTRAPMTGEHNQYVVQELLGYSDEDFAQLIIDNVLT